MDEYVPSKRQLHGMIKGHSWFLIGLIITILAIVAALTRKGILTWRDVLNWETAGG